MKEKRLDYIDIYKGIGMILVVFTHCYSPALFDQWVHSFHMPMFFFISGYLSKFYNYIDWKQCSSKVISKAKRLLLPYLIWGVFHLIIWSVLNYNSWSIKPLTHLFFYNTDGIPIAGGLWFLFALFDVEIINIILQRLLANSKASKMLPVYCSISICIMIIGMNEVRILSKQLPWAIGPAFVGFGIYTFGKLFRVYESKLTKHIANRRTLCFGIFFVALCIVSFSIMSNGYINMRIGQYSNQLLFVVNAIIMSVLILYISRFLEMFNNHFLTLIKYIGQNSLFYLIFNNLIVAIFNVILSKVINNALLIGVLNFVISMTLLTLSCKLLKKTKIKAII